jgi:hypothetical protein
MRSSRRELRPLAFVFSAFAVLSACSAGSAPHATGGDTDDGGNAGTFGDDGGATALAASIEENGAPIAAVTLGCAGACADLQAVARGGHPPYSFVWEDGSTGATRHVCAAADATYRVKATDTGTSGELARAPETVEASLAATVVDCSGDAGVPCAAGAGRYGGQFTCLLEGAVPFVGGLEVTLAGEPTSGALAVTGRLDGSSFSTPFTADLAGTLDCSTGDFSARVENGVVQNGLSVPFLSDFAGTMAASYSPVGPALVNGTWNLQTDPAFVTCNGTWSAEFQGADVDGGAPDAAGD